MKLKVGKIYKTRSGALVKITDIDASSYPARGIPIGTDLPSTIIRLWTESGAYLYNYTNKWDLVEEVTDPVVMAFDEV